MDKYDWRVMIQYLKKKGFLPKAKIRTWSRYGEYAASYAVVKNRSLEEEEERAFKMIPVVNCNSHEPRNDRQKPNCHGYAALGIAFSVCYRLIFLPTPLPP